LLISEGESQAEWLLPDVYDAEAGTPLVDLRKRDASILSELIEPGPFRPCRRELEAAFHKYVAAEAAPRFALSSMQLIRYDVGGFFVAHTDSSASVQAWRRYSIVCYLNDDFDGGETFFENLDATYRH